MNHQHVSKATTKTESDQDHGNTEIGSHDADQQSGMAADQVQRKSVFQNEKIDRPNPQHYCGITVNAVGKTFPAGQRIVLRYGENSDVADPTFLQIAAGGVMGIVGPPPIFMRCQGDDPDQGSQ